jgi:hypothetical protein
MNYPIITNEQIEKNLKTRIEEILDEFAEDDPKTDKTYTLKLVNAANPGQFHIKFWIINAIVDFSSLYTEVNEETVNTLLSAMQPGQQGWIFTTAGKSIKAGILATKHDIPIKHVTFNPENESQFVLRYPTLNVIKILTDHSDSPVLRDFTLNTIILDANKEKTGVARNMVAAAPFESDQKAFILELPGFITDKTDTEYLEIKGLELNYFVNFFSLPGTEFDKVISDFVIEQLMEFGY